MIYGNKAMIYAVEKNRIELLYLSHIWGKYSMWCSREYKNIYEMKATNKYNRINYRVRKGGKTTIYT